MSNEYDYIEVKAYTSSIYPSRATKIVNQGVKGVISAGTISDNAKKIFDQADVWYRENVEPRHLEVEAKETESGD